MTLVNFFFLVFLANLVFSMVYVYSFLQVLVSPNMQGAKLKLKLKNSSDAKHD